VLYTITQYENRQGSCLVSKKIGTYDKEQWEKTVEQKILNGIKNLTFKNAKPKTEFIDVDLVRGSTFPKAKPKQTLLTVVRLAFLRYFFLPLYAKWWILQTSPYIFLVLLILYITQLISWTAYSFSFRHSNNNNVTISKNLDYSYPTAEIVIPILLALTLSLIHSQIVATSSINVLPSARRKLSCNSNGNKLKEISKRRKKLSKTRPSDLGTIQICKFPNRSNLNKQNTEKSILNKQNTENIEVKITESLKVEKLNNVSVSPKKRNVNWDSPINTTHNYVTETSLNHPHCEVVVEQKNQVKDIESITEIVQGFLDNLISKISRPQVYSHIKQKYVEDDGFESLNGKSSSGEEIYHQIENIENGYKLTNETINQNHLQAEIYTVDPLFQLRNRKTRFSSESDLDHKQNKKIINMELVEC